jgi:hypothetical protein
MSVCQQKCVIILNSVELWRRYIILRTAWLLEFDQRQTLQRYDGIFKIFRTDAVQIIKIINKRLWELPTSTQQRATCHTDSLYMVVLPSTGASRYHNCCIDGGTSQAYIVYPLVQKINLFYDSNFLLYKNILVRNIVSLGPFFYWCTEFILSSVH